jgi:glucose-1-phosphate adenylyltransferase
MDGTLVMILAGGASNELPVLTAYRSKAALPYGGKYRVIDFCLSNCSNSGLRDVGVLAQYNPASLIAHIGNGAPWDLSRKQGGLSILQPFAGRNESNWFRGTADALRQHISVIQDSSCSRVLVLSGDQVYKMDYRKLLAHHERSSSPVTMAVRRQPEGTLKRYGALEIDDDQVVRTFVEKPPETDQFKFLSLGIYVFSRDLLIERLEATDADTHDLVFGILLPLIAESRVGAFIHEGYWADIGWLEQYYHSSMDLLGRKPVLDLGGTAWPVMTKTQSQSPSLITKTARVENSLIGSGGLIEGTVKNSILFPGVRIETGVRISDSIVFHDSRIESGVTIDGCILDKKVRVGRDSVIGYGNPTTPNADFPEVVKSGISVIGKGAAIPGGARIGRNCLIGPDVTSDLIPSRDIVCGETIAREERWLRISS